MFYFALDVANPDPSAFPQKAYKDLTALSVQMDRRLLDFLSGIDVEFSELVDGSHLYAPEVSLDQCVLPQVRA